MANHLTTRIFYSKVGLAIHMRPRCKVENQNTSPRLDFSENDRGEDLARFKIG
jgi:hypothetical protein